MKRLDDIEWAKHWGARMPDRRDPIMVILRDDHHQAREDVKRLAERLRAVTAGGHDSGACASLPGPCNQPCDCETGRLLREVGQ